MESLAKTIRFVTLNCHTLSSELQQTAMSKLLKLLRYICVPFTALQETRIRSWPIISVGDCTVYCCDADQKKVRNCAIAVRNDYKDLVAEFGSTPSRCAFIRLRDHRVCKLHIFTPHAPTETAEKNNKNASCDKVNALLHRILRQHVIVFEIDESAMGLEQQSDVLGKCYYPRSARWVKVTV
ncbi:hypothetical protein RB195_024080 [Necator americanus]|uniref:Uncharacterized protein n=1 Tax=Necator americanus TaxID=51031 RepID=A0ABR1EM57_NECAM